MEIVYVSNYKFKQELKPINPHIPIGGSPVITLPKEPILRTEPIKPRPKSNNPIGRDNPINYNSPQFIAITSLLGLSLLPAIIIGFRN